MEETARVAVIKSGNYDRGSEKLFSLLDLESRLKSVEKVLIKINLVRMPQHLDIPLTEKRPYPYL